MLKNKSLISLLFSNFAITLIGLITGLILAKFTSLEVRGEIGKILVWVTFGINLITLGTIEYYYSGGVNKRLVIDKIIYIIVGGFLVSSISVFFYFNNLKEYIYYILFLVPMNLYSLYKISELNLCGYLARLSVVKVIQPFSYLIILLVLIFYKKLNVDYILWANIISNFILILFLFLIPKLDIEQSNKINFNTEWLLVNFSSFLGVIVSNFDKIYITYKYNLEDVALYLVGLTIVGAPIGIIGQTYATKFIYGKTNEESYLKNVFVYIGVTSLVCCLIYFISPFLLKFLFGGKYNGILNIILAIIFLSFLVNFRLILTRILRNLGRNKMILNSELLLVIGAVFILLLGFLNFISGISLFISIYAVMFFINILYLLSGFKGISK